jgi:hypothetical protein
MFRFPHLVVLITVMLWSPLTLAAQEPQQLSLAELQQMVLTQQEMLEDQRQLIDRQTKDLETQARALQKLKTEVDRLAMTAGTEVPGLSPEELALQERLAKVEKQLESPPDAPENVLTAGDFPGSIRIPGTNMAGRVGGFVRLGMVYNLAPIGSDDRFVVATIPTEGNPVADFTEGFTISAKRSRVNLDMRMDSSVGQFRAFVEGDFAGQGGTDNYRLRHAYGQYNRFILGQTWSTLMDQLAEPEELDFEGLNAQINLRHPLTRWTKGLGNNRPFALGLEDPSPDITGGEGVSNFPDVVTRISKQRDWGHLQAGLILRQIVGEPEGEVDTEDRTFGWALTTSGNLDVKRWDERDSFKFQLNFGDGLGRYVTDLRSAGGKDAVFDPENRLKAYPVFAGYVAFQHWWRRNPLNLFRNIRSTWVLGYVGLDNFDFEPDEAYSKTLRSSMNVIWSPISQIDIGVEFLWGRKWVKDGSFGTATQVQSVATFRF